MRDPFALLWRAAARFSVALAGALAVGLAIAGALPAVAQPAPSVQT